MSDTRICCSTLDNTQTPFFFLSRGHEGEL
uniref:Uncharacterized protein n=1 Tax=Vitis vinifera TaxID=29760 RepID=F6HN20_VITVI